MGTTPLARRPGTPCPEEKRRAIELGAQVFEEARSSPSAPPPCMGVAGTATGSLRGWGGDAAKLVFATNAYSHLFGELANKQAPPLPT